MRSTAGAAIEAGRQAGACAPSRRYIFLQVAMVSGVQTSRPIVTGSGTDLPCVRSLQEIDRLVAHLERPLSNLTVAQARFQIIHLHRQGLDEQHNQIFLVEPVLVLAHELLIGLHLHLGSAARVEDGVDLRVLGQEVGELGDRQRKVVIVVERATRDLLPLVGRQGLRHALDAVVHVGRGRAAGLDAICASVGLERHRLLGDGFADLLIDRADIARAQALVGRQQVAVPGHHRDLGLLGAGEHLGDRGSVGGRNADAVDMLGDEVLDDLHLFLLGGVGRADEQALDAADLLRRLHASVARLVEERIVHRLRNESEDLVLGFGGHGLGDPDQGRESGRTRYPHGLSSFYAACVVADGDYSAVVRRARSSNNAPAMMRPTNVPCQ